MSSVCSSKIFFSATSSTMRACADLASSLASLGQARVLEGFFGFEVALLLDLEALFHLLRGERVAVLQALGLCF
jgi:hypothetical protein